MPTAWLKASFLLPLPQADWAGQALFAHFPDGLAQLKPSGAKAATHALFSGWLRRRDAGYLKKLGKELQELGATQFRTSLQKPKDWVRDYKSRFPVQRLGTFTVVPSWRRKEKLKAGSIPIYLLPGQAFGTGLHASTRLMLAAIGLRLPLRGTQARLSSALRVLDIGAGSGILSFAALKLGAASATCVEIEEAACEEMRDNATLNGFDARRLRVIAGAFPGCMKGKKLKADLLLANLVTPLLCAQMKNLAAQTAKGGRLLFSGIHTEAEARKVALAARQAGLKVTQKESKGSWFCLYASK